MQLLCVSYYHFRKNLQVFLHSLGSLGLLLSVRYSLSKSIVLGASGDLERHSASIVWGSSSPMCSQKEFSDPRPKKADEVLSSILNR